MSVSKPLRPQHQEELLLQHLRSFFGVLDEAAIQLVRSRLRWVELAGGDTLMRQGDRGEALYMLVSGRLRVYIEDDQPHATGRVQEPHATGRVQEPHATGRVVREIARGEVVGEMSLYTDAPRSATVVAIRDSVLVSMDKADFNDLLASNPVVSMALTRQIIQRLQTEGNQTVIDKPVTMALMAVSAHVDVAGVAASLRKALSAKGKVALLDSAAMACHFEPPAKSSATEVGTERHRQIAMLLDEMESTHDYVLLVADDQPSEWTQVCLRHADEILLLANASAQPLLHLNEQRYLVDRPPRAEAAEILVLLHSADTVHPAGTAAWLNRRSVNSHLHLRASVAADVARLARIQSRTAVGLVLAGGGARGFAHLGVYRALREKGIDVDYVGGTSIGAVMAALIGSDLPFDTVNSIAREAFARNPTGDFTFFPVISLFKGQRLRDIVSEAVQRIGGRGVHIEDLWKNYFCVATNFSKASEVVITRGDLVKAVLSSVAIPGALPPVVMNGDLLCDGGTFNNFPVDVMRLQRGVGTVIGVDLSSRKTHHVEFAEMPSHWALLRDKLRLRKNRRYRLPSLAGLLVNTTVLYSTSRQKQAQALADVYINPPLDRIGMLDWGRFDSVVQRGYEHTLEVMGDAGHIAAQCAELKQAHSAASHAEQTTGRAASNTVV